MLQKCCVLLLFAGVFCFSTGNHQQSTRNPRSNDEDHYHHHNHHTHRPPQSTNHRQNLPGNPANALLLVKKYFYVRYKPAKFWEAIQYCIDEGKRLASVQSDRDTNALMAVIGQTDKKFWIAGTDQGHEGRWIWLLKDEKIKYMNWIHGQPDNWNGENCLEFDAHSKGQWNDFKCDSYDYYICEDKDTLLNVVGK